MPNQYSLALAVLWTTLLLFLSFKAPSINPKYIFPNQDKVVHYTFYFVFVLLWFRYFIFKKQNTLKKLLAITITAIILGIMIEFAQGILTTHREADIYDAIANTIGSVFAFLVFYIPSTRKS